MYCLLFQLSVFFSRNWNNWSFIVFLKSVAIDNEVFFIIFITNSTRHAISFFESGPRRVFFIFRVRG